MSKVAQFSTEHIKDVLSVAPKFVEHYGHITFNPEAVRKVLEHLVDDGVGFVVYKGGKLSGFILGLPSYSLWTGEPILQELAWWVEEEHRNGAMGLLLLKCFERAAEGRRVVLSILPKTNIRETTLNKLGYVKTEESFVRK